MGKNTQLNTDYLSKITQETLKVFPDSYLRELLYSSVPNTERIVKLEKVDSIITRALGQEVRNRKSRLRHFIADLIFLRLWTMHGLEREDPDWSVEIIYETHSRNWKGRKWSPPFGDSKPRLLLAIPGGPTTDSDFQWNIIYLEYYGVRW